MSTASITRLQTKPRPRAVDEPVPTHVRHAADAVVAKINATQHPNVVALHDFVDASIKTARERGGQAGAAYLQLCVERVESNSRNISHDTETRRHNIGLNAEHMAVATERLVVEQNRLRDGAV